MRSLIALSAALLFAPLAAAAGLPQKPVLEGAALTLANAGIDSCYKKCYLDAKGLSRGRRMACRRTCEATPHKKCENKCWNAFPNDSKKARACVSRCN